jgi:hypothetical protein
LKLELGNSILELGNLKLELGNSILELGNLKLELGNSILELGNLKLELGNSILDTRSLVNLPWWRGDLSANLGRVGPFDHRRRLVCPPHNGQFFP